MPQVERPPQVLTNHRQLMSVKGRCAKKDSMQQIQKNKTGL